MSSSLHALGKAGHGAERGRHARRFLKSAIWRAKYRRSVHGCSPIPAVHARRRMAVLQGLTASPLPESTMRSAPAWTDA